VALLDTGCRPGEILSLQWRDVNRQRREITIRHHKAKMRTERIIPISTRLAATLEMRRVRVDGKEHPPEAYVFGAMRTHKPMCRRLAPACPRKSHTCLNL
jgi:integrase